VKHGEALAAEVGRLWDRLMAEYVRDPESMATAHLWGDLLHAGTGCGPDVGTAVAVATLDLLPECPAAELPAELLSRLPYGRAALVGEVALRAHMDPPRSTGCRSSTAATPGSASCSPDTSSAPRPHGLPAAVPALAPTAAAGAAPATAAALTRDGESPAPGGTRTSGCGHHPETGDRWTVAPSLNVPDQGRLPGRRAGLARSGRGRRADPPGGLRRPGGGVRPPEGRTRPRRRPAGPGPHRVFRTAARRPGKVRPGPPARP
jgi:hypothetical protein